MITTDFFISNFKGVGKVTALKLEETFQNHKDFQTKEDLLNSDTERIREVLSQSFTPSFITKFLSQLKEINDNGDEIKKFLAAGFAYSTATKFRNKDELDRFCKSPYSYYEKINTPFYVIDRYAIEYLGIDEQQLYGELRITSLILSFLKQNEEKGNTYAYASQIARRINGYHKRIELEARTFTSTIVILFASLTKKIRITKANSLDKWKIARAEVFDMENEIASEIKRISINYPISQAQGTIPVGEFEYDDTQKNAIESGRLAGLKIITGPPGSGKTAVINGIISYFKSIVGEEESKIILCAPTGRAAKHIEEISGEPASTIHRLLSIIPGFDRSDRTPLDCNLLICDESSMLTLDITLKLLRKIKSGTVVYFVGDKDQLPAIGAGDVLHDIIDSGVVPVFSLTKVYRQDGIILNNARDINHCIVPTNTSDLYSVETFSSETGLADRTIELFKSLYSNKNPYDTQILIPSYQTPCGIKAINKAVQKLQKNIPFSHVGVGDNYSFKMGDKILMVRNHKDGLYQNGSIGVFLMETEEGIKVQFEDEVRILPHSSYQDMELGYAISIHKSQGSEYKHVILCLPSSPVVMLKKNIVYTAVTRAKNDVHILEMDGTMNYAVKNISDDIKQTELKSLLMS